MKAWKRFAWVLGIIGVVAIATAAVAQGAHRRGAWKQMISHRVEAALDEVDATPDQRATIEKAKDQVLQAFDEKAKQRRQNHPQIAQLITADKLDTAALYKLADARAQDVQDLAKVIVPALQTVHDTLTPAQRQKLADSIQQHHRDRQGGFGGQ